MGWSSKYHLDAGFRLGWGWTKSIKTNELWKVLGNITSLLMQMRDGTDLEKSTYFLLVFRILGGSSQLVSGQDHPPIIRPFRPFGRGTNEEQTYLGDLRSPWLYNHLRVLGRSSKYTTSDVFFVSQNEGQWLIHERNPGVFCEPTTVKRSLLGGSSHLASG